LRFGGGEVGSLFGLPSLFRFCQSVARFLLPVVRCVGEPLLCERFEFAEALGVFRLPRRAVTAQLERSLGADRSQTFVQLLRPRGVRGGEFAFDIVTRDLRLACLSFWRRFGIACRKGEPPRVGRPLRRRFRTTR